MDEHSQTEPAPQIGSTISLPDAGRPVPNSRRDKPWLVIVLLIAFFGSALLNLVLLLSLFVIGAGYFSDTSSLMEDFHSGDRSASDKIAVIEISGTLMPPFTKRYLKMIEQAEEDDDVKGILLVVDSPGGLVADSHQIYHRLKALSEKKRTFVAMKRIAASGGLYVAMGAGVDGKIFAEPTTWTGSIGVIIPRYDISKLAEKVGVVSDSLTTGEFKDSLNPLRQLTEPERRLWHGIIQDSFQRFVQIIADNREGLEFDKVRAELATGRIFTATEAKQNGLIDEIGYEDDALEALLASLGLDSARVIQYQFPPTLLELMTGVVAARQASSSLPTMLEASVPRAWYLCSWGPGLTSLAN